ncbi:MAG: transcriptional repressor [Oscillospiraceae bacterium]
MSTTTRHSKKREEIYRALCSTKSHPSAYSLYEQLKPVIKDLSLATVYRNLNYFIEQGSACVVANVNGEDRFDATTEPHTHFICTDCERVLDLDSDIPAGFINECAAEAQCTITSYNLSLYGLCPNCIKR